MPVQKPLVTESGTTQQLQAGDQIEVNAGTAAAPALTIDGDDNTGIYSPGADQLSISTGGTQRVTVDASGNVGIGTATPSQVVDVVKNYNEITRVLVTNNDATANYNTLAGFTANNGTYTSSLWQIGTGWPLAPQDIRTAGAGWLDAYGGPFALASPTGFRFGVAAVNPYDANASERLSILPTELVVNQSGVSNYDFRVKSVGNANMLFVDASANAVGIGTQTPVAAIDVVTSAVQEMLHLKNTNPSVWAQVGLERVDNAQQQLAIKFVPQGSATPSNPTWYFGLAPNSTSYSVQTWNGTSLQERMVVTPEGNVGIGTTPSSKLDVQAGTLATDGSTSSIKSTSTLPASPSTTIIGNDFTITGAGSSANDFYALRAGVFEGYTGSAGSYGALLFNNSKSTATFSHLGAVKGTAALWGEVAVTAPAPFTGYGIGAYYNVGGGTKNIGVLSRVVFNAGATADTSIGVWGGVDRATNKIGVYASIGTGGSPGDSQSIPTGTAALIADNTNEAAPIFLARDNGTEVVRIADGGAVTIGTTGTSYTLPTADGATNQVLQTNGAGAVSWQTVAASSASLTGNMVWVDSVYGNDATGTRNDDGKPFLTVEAALAAALSGDVVTLRPGTYNVATTLTLPTGVALRGYNRDNTTIQKLNVTADTTLLTMGESSSIQDLRFRLTSTGHHTLKGVLWSGTTTATAHADHVYIDVDNSTAGDVGTSNVYGVHVTATSTPARITAVASNDVIVNVTSAGLGNKRGVLLDTGIAYFRNESCIYSAVRTGVAAGSYIGGEINIASGILAMNAGGYEGTSADMSETAGSLEVVGTDLANDNANGKGFLVTQASPRFTWGVVGPLPAGTRYLYPGTANESVNEIFTRLAAKGIMKSLTVRVRVAPGVGNTDVYTLRKNGVDTALTVSLSDANVWAEILTASVSFAANDDLSISATTVGGSTSEDIIIVAEIY